MNASSDLPRVFVLAGRDRRVVRGHPWTYANEIRMDAETKALPPGSTATLHRVDGKPLGVGSFNPRSLIAFRVFDADAAMPLDRRFFASRLRRALALRERLFTEPYYRLVHAEGDGLPGLVVDRFGEVAVVQSSTAGMDALLDHLLGAMEEVLAPSTIVLRNDGRGRALEGLDARVDVAKGRVGGPLVVREGGLDFLADPLGGQKTGWFFDQRDNRGFLAPLARDTRMLDAYCHTGAFALRAAAAGARSVLGLDGSGAALALARESAARNGLDAVCDFREAEIFEELARLDETGERFGVVAADPPAFVKSRKELKSGLKGYRKLARLAARLVEPGGLLFLASCSHNVAMPDFLSETTIGIGRAGRSGRVLRAAGAAADHPVHPALPETAYLKALVLQLD